MKTITDYLGAQLKGELDRLWADGTLNEEKVESFRTLHERTPYHKKVLLNSLRRRRLRSSPQQN